MIGFRGNYLVSRAIIKKGEKKGRERTKKRGERERRKERGEKRKNSRETPMTNSFFNHLVLFKKRLID
jgi:hypothetical protein